MRMIAWDVWLGARCIDTVFYDTGCDAEYVRRSLIDHDGYSPLIVLLERTP